MPKAALHNLGCKVNAYETEAMKQQLAERGYEDVYKRQEYMTNCMAGMFKTARRKAFSAVNCRL